MASEIGTVNVGDVAEDDITGLQGVVVAIHSYLNGCRRVSIQPTKLQDGKPLDIFTFDEPQVTVVKRAAGVKARSTGGPQPHPKDRIVDVRR